MTAKFDGSSADRFIKERLSLIEIGFRKVGEDVAASNESLPKTLESAATFRKFLLDSNKVANDVFQKAIDELNERFKQAGCNLNYHNGFIQRSDDSLTSKEIETPFWTVVSDPKWKNVDLDMIEALDRRDSGSRDPAFFASRALESAIKIISAERGLTTGKERGAANFIDNLKRESIINEWESDLIKAYFSKVRNPMGHGAGSEEMPSLTSHQTDWAIEACMSWTKSLIRRT